MKKTFTINIAGIIFNIDDDAYEALRKYLDRIRDYFSKQEGGEEVYADIEARIAEHLGTRITETKQVVTMEDITEVTGIMGDVGEIGEESDRGPGEKGKSGAEAKGQRGNRRFYRDPEARILGGVCGGLGAYFNLDPVIFRIVFIILLFSGFGIPVYLVLWIITPLAATPSDRLEMRGEPVTIRNIERSVKTEWTQVKGRINGLAVEAKETYRKSTPVLGEMVENLGKALLAVLRLGWNIIRILLGIIFVIIGLSLIFALVVGIFGLFGPVYSNGSGVILDLPVVVSAMVGNVVSVGLLTLSVLVFLGIPSLLIFYSGLRMAFRIPKVPYAGLTAFNIWLVSFIILIYLGFKISNNYRVPQTLAQKDAVIGTEGPDTLYLRLNTALADSLKVDFLELTALTELTDLCRINGIGPIFAVMLQKAGIHSTQQYAASKPAELLPALLKIQEEGGYTQVKLTVKDLEYCLRFARLFENSIEL